MKPSNSLSPRSAKPEAPTSNVGRQPVAARSAQPEIAIAVASPSPTKAVDAVAPLAGDAEREAAIGIASSVRAAPRQLSWLPPSAKACVPPDPGASPLTATTPPIASEPHSADCGPRTTSIRAGEIGVEQFEARLIARRGIVGADALDEQQGVIGLGAADADLGQRSGGTAGGNRHGWDQPQQSARPAASRAARSALASMSVTLAGVSPCCFLGSARR